ncbi:SdrD B-like domain-containing protein, partial [Alteriqipengyuania sp. WL0013]|uniref:MSCRAMM family protein n=1 Tax=Alteriqipengyuania sp. WL0013 TaxID=3110773 RepID=UPI002C154AD5
VEGSEEGWFAVTATEVSVGTQESGFDVDNVDFANTEYGRIEGYKYEDLDGVLGGTTKAWAGVTISLLDGDGNVIRETQTDADGYYSFEMLVPGTYQVAETLPDGSYAISDELVVFADQTSGFDVDAHFTNVRYGSISGTKTEDVDGDLSTTDDQVLVEGWTINLYDADNNLVETTQTDGDGAYEFANLRPGTYYVQEETRTGWTALTAVTVTLAGQESGFDATVNFFNFEDMSVSGYKWADIDNDGTWDEADTAVLGGFTIVLDNDDDPTNGYLTTTVTAADGSYSFTGLNPLSFDGALLNDADGILHVYELQHDGFIQTYGGFTFTLESGGIVAGEIGETMDGNFGNHMLEGANRTPGFWQSTLGQSLYDGNDLNNGDANGDGKPEGNKDFSEEGWSETDLMTKYGIDTDGDGDNDAFFLWDGNGDGVWDADGDGSIDLGDIVLSAEQLASWVGGGEKGGGRDYAQILERDVGAVFLNTLNNHSLATPEETTADPLTGMSALDPEIAESYAKAIAFILDYDGGTNGDAIAFDGEAAGGKKAQRADWIDGGSEAHIELAAFNENGDAMVGGSMEQILMDGDDYGMAQAVAYRQIEANAEAALEAAFQSPAQTDVSMVPAGMFDMSNELSMVQTTQIA